MTVVVHPNRSLYLIFRILTLCGVWMPPSYEGTWREWMFRAYSCLIMTVTLFSYIFTELMDIIMNLGDMDKNVETFSICSCIVAAAFKTFGVIIRQKRIQKVCDMLDSEIFTHCSDKNAKLMNKYMRAVEMVAKSYIVTAITSTVLWSALPMFDNSSNRNLPLRAWFPWDKSVLSTYIMIYIYQTVGVIVLGAFNASQDLLIASIIILICGELDMLCGDLLSLGQDPQVAEETNEITHLPLIEVATKKGKRRDIKTQFQKCIVHHQAIIECAKEVESIFDGPLFVQFALSCITLCIVAFQMSVTPFSGRLFSHFIYMATLMAELAMFCYPGNEVMVKSQMIPTALYRAPWYKQDMEFKKMMIIFMERTKRPITLTAGHLLPLTLETLTSILQSSYSYYLVLQYLHSDT